MPQAGNPTGEMVGRLTPNVPDNRQTETRPRFTFEGPDGKQVTFEGPPGATAADAAKVLHQHVGNAAAQTSAGARTGDTPGLLKSAASGLIEGAGAPGDLSARVLGSTPGQQPIDKDTYYGKLVDALNTARRALELPTSRDIGNDVGMQPTSPVTLPEKAVQLGAGLIPGMAMGGSAAGRTAMGAAPDAVASMVRGMGPIQMPTQQSFGAQMAKNVGQAPASPVGQLPFPNVGDAAQQAFLKMALKEGLHAAGHAVGGPIGGMAARFAAGKFL